MPEYVGQVHEAREKKNRLSVFHIISSFWLGGSKMSLNCQKSIHNSVLFVIWHIRWLISRENSEAVLSVVSVYNVVFSGGSNMSRWKWQYADKDCSCLSKREKAEPSASDNCRICSCCFKTQFGNFKSGWISSENMFVAPTSTRERWNVTKIGRPSDKRTFRCPVDEGESFSTKVESALRFFRNWTRQRTMNSSP